MARERMVTRTIETTEATLLCIDTNTAEPCNRTIEIGAVKDEKAIMRIAKKHLETDDFKVVKIVAQSVSKALYKMPETDFIAHAKKEIVE